MAHPDKRSPAPRGNAVCEQVENDTGRALLRAMIENPEGSQRAWGEAIGRAKSRVNGKLQKLKGERLVEVSMGRWSVTAKGRAAAGDGHPDPIIGHRSGRDTWDTSKDVCPVLSRSPRRFGGTLQDKCPVLSRLVPQGATMTFVRLTAAAGELRRIADQLEAEAAAKSSEAAAKAADLRAIAAAIEAAT